MFTHKEGVCVCLFTSPFILGHNRQLTVQEKEGNLVSIHVFASSLGVVIIEAYVMFLC